MKKHKKILVFLMALVMLATFIPVFGTKAANGENLDKSGIFQINVYHINTETNEKYLIQTGSGFLISDSTESTQYIITCNHVVTVSDEDQAYVKQALGVDKLNIKVEVVLRGDVTQDVTIAKASEQGDFAILQLSAQISERNAMVLNPDGAVQTADVYAMGFPAAVTDLQDFTYYTEDDVVVTKGSVELKTINVGDMPYIQHSATITGGNSGGPLVDEDGYVIGLNTSVTVAEYGTGTYYYSLDISEVTKTLDILNIPYKTKDSNPEPTTTEETTATTTDPTDEQITTEDNGNSIDTTNLDKLLQEAKGYIEEDYTEDSFKDLEDAIDNATEAKSALESQSAIDTAADDLQEAIDGLEKASGTNTTLLIIIIAAVVVVIIVIIVIVVVNSGKKKKKSSGNGANRSGAYSAYGPGAQAASRGPISPDAATGTMNQAGSMGGGYGAQPQPPRQPGYGGSAQQPGYGQRSSAPAGNMNDGAGETSVLGYGAGETSVLGGAGRSHATLTRVKTNERIQVSKQLFRIGKERSKVDYCIMNNNAVSRVHAELILKNGQYYIMDNNSTNYTFVNGQMIPAKQETPLSNGDRIKFAEEEFIFNV